ncbi:hypothetical protein RFI_12228 [Reticulomyxa filosa]|uniref:DUF7164 domain-containing protein n=1 Tax=Reticulomyxa filosa TaxID=46433 RepID=X6NGV0_RETFI|nr:hypothetical protein RFI_12228 [Reticulomyxa filosa]|eukprot:ETO24929.1 hypothetical protein RFI_12228 [Reticulomyxa filosa]
MSIIFLILKILVKEMIFFVVYFSICVHNEEKNFCPSKTNEMNEELKSLFGSQRNQSKSQNNLIETNSISRNPLFRLLVVAIAISLTVFVHVLAHVVFSTYYEKLAVEISNSTISSNSYIRLNAKKQELKTYRTMIAVELSERNRDLNEFIVMMHASWKYVTSLLTLPQTQPLSNHPLVGVPDKGVRVLLDLIVFCEKAACSTVQGLTECRVPLSKSFLMSHANHSDYTSGMQTYCFWHELDSDYVHRSMRYHYRFLTSLQFLQEKPMIDILPFYDYIIRTDMDAVITPNALLWTPPHQYAFGNGYMGSTFTHERLEYIAKHKLHTRTCNVHGMQSTWYVHRNKFLELVHWALNFTEYVHQNEFTETVCAKEVLAHGHHCNWPDWHQGVSSLYGSELAINHVFCGNKSSKVHLTNDWKSFFLDSIESNEIRNTVQFHMLQMKHSLLEMLEGFWNLQEIKHFCANYRRRRRQLLPDIKGKTLEDLQSNEEYALYFFRSGIKTACSTLLMRVYSN